jgi:hypothetical protein
LVDRRKQAKLKWSQDPSEVNENNLSKLRWEANRYFKNKKGEYFKNKINELISHRKNMNVRDLYRAMTVQEELPT